MSKLQDILQQRWNRIDVVLAMMDRLGSVGKTDRQVRNIAAKFLESSEQEYSRQLDQRRQEFIDRHK